MDRDFVEAHFPTTDAYRAFVADYVAMRRLPDALGYLKAW